MKQCYLEVTYRKGRALAAYYYLPRTNEDKSTRSEQVDRFVVDFAADGRAIGVEITSPAQLDLAMFNQLLERLGHRPAAAEELAPLLVA